MARGAGQKRFRPAPTCGGNGFCAGLGFFSGALLALVVALWRQHTGELPVFFSGGTQLNSTIAAAAAAAGQAATAAAELSVGGGADQASNVTDYTALVMHAAKVAADAIDRLMDVGSLPHLFLSYGNAAYFEFVHNWALSVEQIGAPYVVGSFDDAMLGLCANHSLTCVPAQFATTSDFRGDFAAFRAMGAIKAQLVLEILERHPQLPLLVVSDSDTVWLRKPWAYFEQRPAADFFISTDCLSTEMEEAWTPKQGKPTCGHIPGNWFYAFNTGLFAVRNRPAPRKLMASWVMMLTDPGKQHDKDGHGVDDQLALNLLFDSDLSLNGGTEAISEDEPRVIWVCSRTLSLQALPVALFPGGHVAFVQRAPWKLGVEPIVIHLTYQRWWNGGKRSRMREFGLWHIEKPEYYSSASGGTSRFLTYENNVVPWVNAMASRRYPNGRQMPLFYKMWLGMSYQLAAFRDALAAATMLGRAVVLPKLWCWCDYHEGPDILRTCLKGGADYAEGEPPFQCPMDFMLNVEILDWQEVEYRNPGFLELPQVPAAIRNSRVVVEIAGRQPDGLEPPAGSLVGRSATAWPGIPQEQLERVVKPVETAAVLELRGFVPGFLGDFTDQQQAASFDLLWATNEQEARWCCATWGPTDEEYRTIDYARARPFQDGWAPWTAPKLLVPAWCDKVSKEDGNHRFTKLAQHPCQFLRDPSTAPVDDDR
ncbi:hypothetical protein D9Q98_005511 [Chlorella vulgaris]|uniref:Nucleotide-diphospho-sugar transferase domain-containing protein n=1 Tax=Chlorella vulgaris TaxID=3077 RepID=A0A9D4TLY5_CHLVU|nr:hypothetical protein D9Q98_005511 [Chlorella vulgaris]